MGQLAGASWCVCHFNADSLRDFPMDDVDPTKPYILTIRDVLSSAECESLIRRIESLDPEVATINTVEGARVNRDVRNNDRVIFEDQSLADLLFERVRPQAPPEIHGMRLVGANEMFRCYRYKPGMRFAPHADAAFVRNDDEQSFYSFLVYLNDGFTGGATTFITKPEVAIKPETGMALLFQHPIIHEGSIVKSGVKYVARSDLMYRRMAE
ncbi:MAG: 2OG-Fe(II) oxygenase [Planctomycetaceae bacterium]|nr:2OG-Fe(II) oxygenase [Planctomycetaceae bacterium]